jgi:ATP-binding cassette, subfamily B, multidrug efflux pump
VSIKPQSEHAKFAEPSLSARFTLIWSYLRHHPRQLTLGILSLIARDAVAFSIPLLIRAGVNALTHSSGSHWSIGFIALAMVGVAIPRSAFQTSARLNVMNTSRDVEYAMRRDLLQSLFRLDASFWGRTRTGDVMASATNDLNAVRMMLGPGMTSLFESVVSLPVAIIVMGLVDWHLTLVALLPAPLAVFLLIRFGAIIRHRFNRIQGMFASMSASIQQMIAGVRIVRSFVREDDEQRRFERQNMAYLRANRALGTYGSSLDPLLTFIMGLSVLAVLGFGGAQVLAHTLDVGSFVMFTTYVAMLTRPIAALGRVVNLMQRGMASVGRLYILFEESPGIVPEDAAGVTFLSQKEPGDIVFESVSVDYGHMAALTDVDLRIRSGSTVAILGETGSGKSTLVRLVTRMVDPSAGRVLINGTDCRQLALKSLRSSIGCVPQDTFLFSVTIAENIALGAPEASDKQIRAAAEIAGLNDDLAAMPAGLETVVGERGIMLSGGQKQRIAIARAILKNPGILILDDSLSSVDSVTEQRILNYLKTIMAERTTVLITHRVSTAMQADHIVILDQGRIVEQGTHASLLKKDRQYATLSRLQTLERELEVM